MKLVCEGKERKASAMENFRRLGAFYEDRAARLLEERGYRILEKNYRCRIGEIDLIARDGRTLVFIEVKYRRTDSFGRPEEAVDARKQRTICRAADYYRMEHRIEEFCPCRFDVAVFLGEEMRLLRNAFPYQKGK